MNLQGIKCKIQGLSEVTGVEIFFDKEGSAVYTCALFEVKSGEFFLKEETVFSNSSLLVEKLNKKTPIVLTISGKGVLTKRIDRLDNSKPLLQHVLPNAQEDDFVIQQVMLDKQYFLSVVRIDQIYKCLEPLNSLNILSLSLGGMPSISLLQELDEDINSVHFGYHTFFENNYHCNEKKENKPLDKLKIPSEVLPSFTAAFDFVLNRGNAKIFNTPISNDKREDWVIISGIKQAGVLLLGLVFIILVVNTFLWQKYSKTVHELEPQAFLFEKLIAKENKLSNELNNNRQFLVEIGWNNATKFSFYVDRIALTIPKTVKLYDANLYPLDQKSTRKAHRNIYQKQMIYLHGYVKDSRVLNFWVEELEKKEWLSHVKLDRYDFNEKLRQGDFTLKLEVNEKL